MGREKRAGLNGQEKPKILRYGSGSGSSSNIQASKAHSRSDFYQEKPGINCNNPLLGLNKGSLASNMSIPTILK